MRDYESVVAISVGIARRVKAELGRNRYRVAVEVLGRVARSRSPSWAFAHAVDVVAMEFVRMGLSPDMSPQAEIGLRKLGRWMAVVSRDFPEKLGDFVELLLSL